LRVRKLRPLDFDAGLQVSTPRCTVSLPGGAASALVRVYGSVSANPCSDADAAFGVYTYSWPADPHPSKSPELRYGPRLLGTVGAWVGMQRGTERNIQLNTQWPV